MNCLICHQDVPDLQIHAHTWSNGNEGLTTGYIDAKHEKALREFAKKGWEGNCPLCGHFVFHTIFGADHWEIECPYCGYLFDED